MREAMGDEEPDEEALHSNVFRENSKQKQE